MPTPLVDWLRTQDDDTLARLVALRPDLGVPPPADTTVLATRAAVRASVHRTCDELDTVALAVLEALAVADADTAPVSRDGIARLLGPDVPAEALTGALEALRARAVAWGPDAEISVVAAVRDVVPRHPGGLGRRSSGPAGSSALPELLAGVDEEERRVLETLAAGPPVGRSRGAGDSPVGRLLARGLLLRIDPETVELPRQVGLALRGDHPLGTVAVEPPDIAPRDRGADVVDGTAAGAALGVLRQVEALLALWGRTPPPVLRSGGLGVRDLRRAAKEMDVDEATAALLVEVVVAADLAAASDGASPEWTPTTGTDVWLAGGPEVRWSLLARTWLALPRLPGLVGRKDDAGRPINALSDGARRPLAPRDRRRVLAGLAELPPGTAPGSPAALADLLAWRAPRRGGRLRDEVVGWTVTEGTVLGVVALDALSRPGRALLTDPDGIVDALRTALPEPIDHVLLQADLTAVAPGPLVPELARELDLMAEVESAGGATVYRFTEATVRRALDAGRSATDLHELLQRRSATPVPQGLTYLVDDVARRHGRLRGGAAASFLRSDDEVLISEVMAHPDAVVLELRRIAPTVAVSPLPLVELLDALRSAGFSPAAEDTGGVVLDLAERGRRIPPARRSAERRMPPQPDPEQLARLVARMRAGDALTGVRRGTANGRGSTLDTLRRAADERLTVWLGFVDGHGVAGERVLEPLSVGGGVVEGRDRADGGLHRVPLHRITSIALVEE
ncbi:helicase-associated domain-containing protein [Pseudonocardia sp. KRD-184]|uniref:Helicase-associated domain-containing protein n=1 Tax=Pseudonocardia oceani TaxID=2792013 RepID=A0ABS6U824_9PSEU|nr:helicase-associated domain-containing protein [Pseudonocardia oceani]MBW0092771.1 helicase-associated domain-containing protein [Pseudonocardia oceani]MBW0098855.1 helicase-associated domain-containing protein [Pseudonocardia oceani]MBW0112908.1 helicase-associated domain-containing protein [Pseudonocardia oceani]MBW0123100.1 helicase-associated domain-containing protein [Pseudonocardia oceani]MBW0128299.1 helicase-associated domain-containing protein [Pseudonocardia oceani]